MGFRQRLTSFFAGSGPRGQHRSPGHGSGPINTSAAEFHVGEWRVRPRAGKLIRRREARQLPTQTMQMLLLLAARPGEVLTRDELLAELWPDTVVTESSLTRCISELRTALDDDRRDPKYIETLPKRGYRLVARVERERHGDGLFRRLMPAALFLIAFGLLSWALDWNVFRPNPAHDSSEGAPLSLALEPAQPEAAQAYRYGVEALLAMDLEPAALALRESSKLAPEFSQGRRALIEALLLSGRVAEARDEAAVFPSATESKPREERILISGWSAMAQLDWSAAAELFRALTVLHPSDPEAALGLTRALFENGDFRGTVAEIERYQSAAKPPLDPRFLLILSESLLHTGDFEGASKHSEVALAEARTQGKTGVEIRAQALLGKSLLRRGDLEAGLASLELALGLAEKQDAQVAQGEILRDQGFHFLRLGRFEDGQQACAGALTLARTLGHQRLEAAALSGLARAAQAQGNWSRAEEYFQRSREIVESIGDRDQLAKLFVDLAIFAATHQGDMESARDYFEKALEIARDQGAERVIADLLINLSNVSFASNRVAEAAAYVAEASSLYRRMGNREGLARARHNEGLMQLTLGKMDSAAEALRESSSQFRELGNERMVASSLERLGAAEAARGQLLEARQILEEALRLRLRLGSALRVELSRLEIARLALLECDPRRAEIESMAIEKALEPEQMLRLYAKSLRIEALLEQDRVAEAQDLLAEGRSSMPTPKEDFWTRLEIWVYLRTGELSRADRQLRELTSKLAEQGLWSDWAKASLLQAQLSLMQGNAAAARRILEPLRAEASGRGWAIMAGHADALLAACDSTSEGSPSRFVVTLCAPTATRF